MLDYPNAHDTTYHNLIGSDWHREYPFILSPEAVDAQSNINFTYANVDPGYTYAVPLNISTVASAEQSVDLSLTSVRFNWYSGLLQLGCCSSYLQTVQSLICTFHTGFLPATTNSKNTACSQPNSQTIKN